MKTVAVIMRVCAIVFAWVGCCSIGHAQTFQDYFTNRETFSTAAGSLSGNNSTATVEIGEPLHAGKPGGHSLWISWVAPTNGIARFKTESSSFDTLLAAYYFNSTNDTTFDKLIVAARDDDSEELDDRESEIDFPVVAGQRYEIAVDGFYGAVGSIEMQWRMDATIDPPPRVLSTTPDTTLQIGTPITLTVVLTNAPTSVKYQWFLNGTELGDEKNTNLVISSMQATNVGSYKLQIDVGSHITFFSFSTELQINTEGANALAQAKFPDAPGSQLTGNAAGNIVPHAGGFGVVAGYNGSQIFNTTFATADPAEPLHCSTPGGASYWLAYQPPVNGTVTLDTVGSSYDTVMEVYTYNSPPIGFQDLISLTCDHDSVAGGSRVQFAVTKTRHYIVAVAGVNGARGTAFLNYSLNTNQLPQPPQLTETPQKLVVTNGANVLLVPPVTGAPPLHYLWSLEKAAVTNSTDPFLALSNVTPDQAGIYSVTITNDLGLTNATLPLRVVIPPSCSLAQSTPGNLQLSFPTQSGLNYTVEEAPSMSGPWQSVSDTFVGSGQPIAIPLPVTMNGFYRVRVE